MRGGDTGLSRSGFDHLDWAPVVAPITHATDSALFSGPVDSPWSAPLVPPKLEYPICPPVHLSSFFTHIAERTRLAHRRARRCFSWARPTSARADSAASPAGLTHRARLVHLAALADAAFADAARRARPSVCSCSCSVMGNRRWVRSDRAIHAVSTLPRLGRFLCSTIARSLPSDSVVPDAPAKRRR